MFEIFLPKFHDKCYNNCNEIDKRLWLFGTKSFDEMRNIINNDDNLYILEELERLSMNDNFIDEYDHEIVTRKINDSYKIEGYNEGKIDGISEGKELGINESKIEIAKNMLSKNLDLIIIAECTNLSIEEVENLKSQI